MQRLASKDIKAAIEEELKVEASNLSAKGIQPCLAVILVGDDPASAIYVGAKKKACQRVGIKSIEHKLSADTSQEKLMEIVAQLNADDSVHGILCQVPLPDQCNEDEVLFAIHPDKDVDCFHPHNVGLLTQGHPRYQPCTPFGVMQILKRSGITTEGKKAVIVGRSNIVGRPLSILMSLSDANCTVTMCHSRTKDLKAECRQADILVAAIGKPEFITKDFVKPGAVVIDVGVNRIEDPNHPKGARVVGDVAYAEMEGLASATTPVPGGVGPMTIAMLMYNCLNAARFKNGLAPFEI
ncbi:MAG: bifunctional methylenetetrahydrofolate dehydrogenase/methenyltetrahydrofolate cyclohydrolase FolD [SAR324 cluster bacterium]|nr:bifunctional methylenetetrahydrofolate dehydrogenase/methenyltetrahydrofolate cyclohydrolase FolD [SAR324 cluster bacterium]